MRLAETFGAAELVAFDGTSDDVFAEMIDAVGSGDIDAFVDDEPAFGGAASRAASSGSRMSRRRRTRGARPAAGATTRWR